MKKYFFEKLMAMIAILFICGIGMSLIPDQLHHFFGDTHHLLPVECKWNGSYEMAYQEHYHWGVRHWLWLLMSLCLFIVGIVRIGHFISSNSK